MRRYKTFLPFLALACGVLSAQPSGISFYTLEKELALGRQLADDTRKRTVPVEDADVQNYVNRVGKRLTAQVNTPFSLSFEVVAGLPDNPTHEPLQIPGGYLFIPADLVLAAHDEEEFAGILAHSIAHVANRDFTRAASSGQISNYGTIPLVFVVGWQNGLALPKAFTANARRFEVDADIAAMGIMRKAGYDPRALVRYIARVQPETISGQWPFPQRDARIDALDAAIQELGATDFIKVQEHVREQVGEPAVRKIPSLFAK